MTSSKARKGIVAIVLVAALSGQSGVPAAQAATLTQNESRSDRGRRERQTATPIKHVIIIVGENRSFDHLFATYVPKRKREKPPTIFPGSTTAAVSMPMARRARSTEATATSATRSSTSRAIQAWSRITCET